MDINMCSIGKRLRERRKALGLTQTDIYKECGIASGALSQIENGTRTPSIIIFYKLSQALQCDMEWLIAGESTVSKNVFIYENEETLLNTFRELSSDDQSEILDFIELKIKRKKRNTQKAQKSSHLKNDSMVI